MSADPGSELRRLVGIMARLRAEGGCPWDREQDIRSLRPYLIEEAYEVLDEMDRVADGGSWKALCEELGDLLFQIVFHAQLGAELGEFTMADVARAISDKIESRHPHVFGEAQVKDAEHVLQNWAKLKAAERKRKHGREGSVLDGVPKDAPALQRAERLTEKASRIGFDWPDLAGVRAKLDEELRELDEAIASKARDELEHELGDVLFSLANLARFIRTAPEDALRGANARFTRRFHEIEAGLREQGVAFGEASLDQMEALWQVAKKKEALLPKPAHLPRAELIAFTVTMRDEEAMKRFWTRAAQLFGWSSRRSEDGALAWDAGAVAWTFVPASSGAGPSSGAVQMTLSAPSQKSVQHVHAELQSMNAHAVKLDPDGLAVSFEDPDGNRFRYAFAR